MTVAGLVRRVILACRLWSYLNVGRYVPTLTWSDSCLIYSSPGTQETHKTELENQVLVMLVRANHKHSLVDGWMV